MNGIGYQFAPGQQQERGNGAPPISPQEAVRILSFQLPKSQLGAGAVAPRGLLTAQGAQGAPNGILAQILAALSGGQSPVKQGPFAQPAVGPFERQTNSFTGIQTAPTAPAPPRFTVEQPTQAGVGSAFKERVAGALPSAKFPNR